MYLILIIIRYQSKVNIKLHFGFSLFELIFISIYLFLMPTPNSGCHLDGFMLTILD